ncbi:regulatory protein YycH of two-component signal transduction system YycFG [Tumebacillus sp. BK434]|uniref:YycH family regulatory protein n=1 Tax=Tumebacillus sp. BK434 TaxID=2512169 RepID=UPI0010DEF759|nr:two-component system activity regulator YycH [Tumebacillus sp. BK434]TCP52548.1 regulatory protein YycH of two-component signal transduction system YycFG [Tumebacillus sp. BK434]
MKEKLKTLLLTVLVITSLLLSLGIWSITPQYEAIDGPQFASNTAISDPSFERTLNNVLGPRSILLHGGEEKHQVLFPGQSGYESGMELLTLATFFDIKLATGFQDDDWKKLISTGPSLQYDFDAVVPITLLNESELLHFTSRLEPFMNVKTFYLFPSGGNEFRAVFVANADMIYSASVVLPQEPFKRLFEAEKEAPLYKLYGTALLHHFYLPILKPKVYSYSIDVNRGIETERLVDSFFLDKSLTRRVVERAGSEIVTDGNRIVRIDALGQLIQYRNLNLEESRFNQLEEDTGIPNALDFANAHGGFVGSVAVHQVRSIRPTEMVGRQFEFRPLVEGLPVIGDLSSVAVQVVNNDVAAMRRSPLLTGAKPVRGPLITVLSGAEVIALVEQNALLKTNRVTDIYLAYLMGDLRGDAAQLRPVWVVEQAGDYREGIFDAVTGEELRSEEGTIRGLE